MSRPCRTSFLAIQIALVSHTVQAAPLTAADYQSRTIQGWTVFVEKSLDTHPRKAQALELLDKKLAEVTTLVPAAALPKLKVVPIWMSRNVAPGACYHPSVDWLKQNGRVVEMARSIEFQNVDHFLDWSAGQPLMVLHELAHAWQDREAPQGYGNEVVERAFEAAKASGKYEKVRYVGGGEKKHYALTNPMEYFAECSEAYFGKNDFQPFDRAELKAFDPGGFEMVEKVWGIAK
jgi:dipeptidyl-peptidase-4